MHEDALRSRSITTTSFAVLTEPETRRDGGEIPALGRARVAPEHPSGEMGDQKVSPRRRTNRCLIGEGDEDVLGRSVQRKGGASSAAAKAPDGRALGVRCDRGGLVSAKPVPKHQKATFIWLIPPVKYLLRRCVHGRFMVASPLVRSHQQTLHKHAHVLRMNGPLHCGVAKIGIIARGVTHQSCDPYNHRPSVCLPLYG